MTEQIGRVIVGQKQVVEQLLMALFSRGHCLLVGVPGLAKTLMVNKLAETMSLKFSRIQFTPDLMPMDITGTDILQDTAAGRRELPGITDATPPSLQASRRRSPRDGESRRAAT